MMDGRDARKCAQMMSGAEVFFKGSEHPKVIKSRSEATSFIREKPKVATAAQKNPEAKKRKKPRDKKKLKKKHSPGNARTAAYTIHVTKKKSQQQQVIIIIFKSNITKAPRTGHNGINRVYICRLYYFFIHVHLHTRS